jgi:hypothetical protein
MHFHKNIKRLDKRYLTLGYPAVLPQGIFTFQTEVLKNLSPPEADDEI